MSGGHDAAGDAADDAGSGSALQCVPAASLPGGEGRQVALITGASAGIGRALAQAFAAHGFDCVLVARRAERLQELAASLHDSHDVTVGVVVADLADPTAPARLHALLTEAAVPVDVLANNAGLGSVALFAEAPLQRHLQMIDLNVRALVALTHLFLPGLIARRARVLQVASIAGFLPGPRAATYYASKAFVVSHAEALRHELKDTGASVTVLCPGPVATEFQAVAGVKDTMGTAEELSDVEVARLAVDATLRRRFLVVPGRKNQVLWLLTRLLPNRLLAALVDDIQRRRRPLAGHGP